MLKYLNPLLWFRWAGQFFNAWVQSILWRDAPRAIPALILVLVLTVTGVVAWNGTSSWRDDQLNRQLQLAWDEENFATAELVVMRQLRSRPDDATLLYRLALTRDAKGESENAVTLMRDLARIKRHEAAARWVLQKEYFGNDWGTLQESQRDEFGELLKLIHEQNPEDIPITQLYADYLIAAEKYTQAIPVLGELISVQPMRGLQAAALTRSLGNDAAADRLAEKTLEKVSRMLGEDPTNSRLALAVAQNQLFLKRYAEAVRTLELAASRAKADEDRLQLNQAIGDSIVAWVSSIEETSNRSVNQRLKILQMLEVALEHAPNNPRVLTLVADQVLATADQQDEQITAVRKALIDGSSTGIAHFIRGTAALMKDDVETATTSLQLAADHMPQSGAILNNLAVALSMRDESNLEQALKISESAIKQTPNATPHFFETRGQILYRMGRYLDAIPDLERALAVEELAPAAHQTLADCYKEIGEPELSRLHREAAGDIIDDAETAVDSDTAESATDATAG